MIEMGEMVYASVDESDLDQQIKDNMGIDDWISVLENEGEYVCGEYEIYIDTPNEDIHETREHEVHIEMCEAVEFILDHINQLQAAKSNAYTKIQQLEDELKALKAPVKDEDEISDITMAISA